MKDETAPSLDEVQERVRQDIGLIREAVTRQTSELRDAAADYVDRHPYAAVGAAMGLGFILAGGLFSRVTVRTLSLGAQFLVGRLIKETLTGVGVGYLTAALPRSGAGTR